MGGCQNYGHFLGTLNIRCRIIVGIQKGTIILTTTHMFEGEFDKRLTSIRQLRLRGTGIWEFLLLVVLTGMGLALGL